MEFGVKFAGILGSSGRSVQVDQPEPGVTVRQRFMLLAFDHRLKLVGLLENFRPDFQDLGVMRRQPSGRFAVLAGFFPAGVPGRDPGTEQLPFNVIRVDLYRAPAGSSTWW